MKQHMRFRLFYIKMVGAAKQTVFMSSADIDEIEEFDHKTDMRGITEKRCNIYTKNNEFVVRHSADEIFDMVDKSADDIDKAKRKDMEELRTAMRTLGGCGEADMGKKPN